MIKKQIIFFANLTKNFVSYPQFALKIFLLIYFITKL